MLGRSTREQKAQEIGFETGKAIMEQKPESTIAERQAHASEVAKEHGLKRTQERLSFFGGHGDGVAEGMIQNARTKHSR